MARINIYTIKQKGANVSLDLTSANVNQGANIASYQANGSNAQKWAIKHNGSNGYRNQAKASGYSLDISGGTVANGASVIQNSGSSSGTQSWLFIPYEPAQELAEGRYILLSGVDNSLELDVPGDTGNVSDGAGIQIWADTTPSRYNSFNVKKLNNGYYSITHNASGKVMEVLGGGSGLKTQASLYTPNSSFAQQWAVTSAGSDDSYMLQVRSSGYYLDLLDSTRADGNASATAAGYAAGGKYKQNKDTTLYAVWEKLEPDMILPSSLETIGEEAFAGGAFKYVKLPEGTAAIGKRAFADCPNLKDIYIPEATVSIMSDAFEGVSGLTIHGKTGSYAEFYAGSYGYSFLAETD